MVILEKGYEKIGVFEQVDPVGNGMYEISFIFDNGEWQTVWQYCSFKGVVSRDLLSPFLSLLCVEGFSCKLGKAIEKGALQKVTIARNSPQVSHLFFADDNLLFVEPPKVIIIRWLKS